MGKFKDECSGNIMTEFIGLRSKMYTYKIQDETFEDETVEDETVEDGTVVIKKLKGVRKPCLDNKITFEDYYDSLFNKKEKVVSMNLIRSKKHTIFSVKQNKLALSSKDEKRCILENKINTLPFGHYSIV